MSPSLIIVVPIYYSNLSEDEQISLHQVEQICPYPKCIVAPAGMTLPEAVSHWHVEYFDPSYFTDIQAYNRLMLSTDFYERFMHYTYLMIHQTDAFLFRDELDLWIKKGYPYVGAPWLIKRKYMGWKRILLYLRALPHRLQGRPFLPLDLGGKVGNGGLSLRRIKDFIAVTKNQSDEIQRWLERSRTIREFNEDCFWGTRPGWTYPSAEEALSFSFDLDPADAFIQNHHTLPMGCHGWLKPQYRPFWWPYIQSSITNEGTD